MLTSRINEQVVSMDDLPQKKQPWSQTGAFFMQWQFISRFT